MKSRTSGTRLVAFALALLLVLPVVTVLLPSPVYAEDAVPARATKLTVCKDKEGTPLITEDTIAWRLLFFPAEDAPKTWYITLSEGNSLEAVQKNGEWDRDAQILALERLYMENKESPSFQIDELSEPADFVFDETESDAADFVQRLWQLSDEEQVDLLGNEGAAAAQEAGRTIYGLEIKDGFEPTALRLTTVSEEKGPTALMAVGTAPVVEFPEKETIDENLSVSSARVRWIREDHSRTEETAEGTTEGTAEILEEAIREKSKEAIDREDRPKSENAPKKNRSEPPAAENLNDKPKTETTEAKKPSAFAPSSDVLTKELFATDARQTADALIHRNSAILAEFMPVPPGNGGGDLGDLASRGTYSWTATVRHNPTDGQTFIDWEYTVDSDWVNTSPYVDFEIPDYLLLEGTVQTVNGLWVRDEGSGMYYAYSPKSLGINNPMTVSFTTRILSWDWEPYQISFRPSLRRDTSDFQSIRWYQIKGNKPFTTAGRDYTQPAPDQLTPAPAQVFISRDLTVKTVYRGGNPADPSATYEIRQGDTLIRTITTGEEGIYTVYRGLDVGETYKIKQTKAPDGYRVVSENPQTVTLPFGVTVLTFVNEKITYGDVKIRLKETDTQTNLPGGWFELWTTGDHPKRVQGPIETDADGTVVFPDAEHGRAYEVRQTLAPPGYAPASQPTIVTPEGPETTAEVFNDPLRVAVTLQDPEGGALEGGAFVLKNADGVIVSGDPMTTDAEGKLTFSGSFLLHDAAYSVEQTAAPEGFKPSEAQSITLRSATTEVVFVNRWEAALELALTDPDGVSLAGGRFRLTRSDASAEEETTDEDGKAFFKDLEPGTYTLKQMRAPDRHIPDPNEYTVIVHPNGKRQVILGEELLESAPLRIENQPMGEFPATGGCGGELIMFAGAVVMTGGGFLWKKQRT